MIQPLRKTLWRFLKKIYIYDPAIPLLGVYLKETKIEKGTCTPIFISALFTKKKKKSRSWKQPRHPLTKEWVKNYGTYIQ